MESNKNNNSSNSLVFGLWPLTKIENRLLGLGSGLVVRRAGSETGGTGFNSCSL